MFPLSQRWMMVSAIGQGVLFSLAFTGAVRIACWSLGTTLPERVAGNLFLISCVLTGSLAAYLYARYVKHAEQKALAEVPLNEHD